MIAIATTVLLYSSRVEGPGATPGSAGSAAQSCSSRWCPSSCPADPAGPGTGPYSALNLRQIWLMVVLISGVSLAGYLRAAHDRRRHGAALLGLFGGLASSTATSRRLCPPWSLGTGTARLCPPPSSCWPIWSCWCRLAVLAAVVSPTLLSKCASRAWLAPWCRAWWQSPYRLRRLAEPRRAAHAGNRQPDRATHRHRISRSLYGGGPAGRGLAARQGRRRGSLRRARWSPA